MLFGTARVSRAHNACKIRLCEAKRLRFAQEAAPRDPEIMTVQSLHAVILTSSKVSFRLFEDRTMFNFRPDLHWLGSRFGRSDEEEVPGFRFKPPEDDVPGFRVKPPHEQVPGFRMNADGSIKEAEATTARPYSGPGGNPFDFFEQPSTGANAILSRVGTAR